MLMKRFSEIGKRKVIESKKGFTLIEVIAVLLIVGVMAALGGMGIVQAVKGYLAVKENAAITQKAQLAMSRITREIQEMISMESGTAGGDSEVLRIVGTANCLTDDNCVRRLGRPASSNPINVRNTVKIVFGSNPIRDGDTLIDNVTNFQFTYYSGNVSSTSWAPGNDVNLTGIGVNMTVNRSDGKAISFQSLIDPRNNGNMGGANVPSAVPPGTPAQWNVNCFVATAAYGDATHPMVQILRDFRDRELIHWPGGKAFIHLYYQNGPKVADMIRNHPAAMWAVRCLLAPIVYFAFCLMYAPMAIPFMFLVSVFITLAVFSVYRRKTVLSAAIVRSRGSILIALIITMVVMALLAAAMLPMFSSSYMNQFHADQGRKAYFLAESGYRYAAGRFLWAGTDPARDAVILDLNGAANAGKIVNLLNNAGSFRTQIQPFWFNVNSFTAGSNSLVTNALGKIPTEFNSSCSGGTPSSPCGYLKVGDGNTYSYNVRTVASNGITFGGLYSSSSSTISSGQTVLPVAQTSNATATQTLTNKGKLNLSSYGAEQFPEYNGIFTFDFMPGTTFNYIYRKGTVLYNITLGDKSRPWSNVIVPSNTKLILEKFLRITSTGTTKGGATRQVSYDTSLTWLSGAGGKVPVEDQIGEKESDLIFPPNTVTVTNTINVAQMKDIPALSSLFPGFVGWILSIVEAIFGFFDLVHDWVFSDCDSFNPALNFIAANPTQLTYDPAQAWVDGQGFLSYDIQVKVEAEGQKHFFAGPTFRGRNDASGRFASYGVSFARAKRYSHPGDLGGCTACYAVDQFGPLFGPVEDTPLWRYGPIGSCPVAPSAGLEKEGDPDVCSAGPDRPEFEYSLPAIILWKIVGGKPQMIAYRILSAADGIVSYDSSTNAWRLNPNYSTLMVRVAEGYAITFNNGTSEIKKNDIITNAGNTRRAQVVAAILDSGSWADGNAAGTLVVSNVRNGSGTFSGAINKGGTQVANATNFDQNKRNYISAYFSHPGPADQGTPNNVVTDNNRHANQIGQHNWPPDNPSDLAAGNDYFTLVQWAGTANDTKADTVFYSDCSSGWSFEKKHSFFGIPYSNWSHILGNMFVAAGNLEEFATSPTFTVNAGVTYEVDVVLGLASLDAGMHVYFGCQRAYIPLQHGMAAKHFKVQFRPTVADLGGTSKDISIRFRPDEPTSATIYSVTVTPFINGALGSQKAVIRDSDLTSPSPNTCLTNTSFTCGASDFEFGINNAGDTFGLLTIGETGKYISYDDWWIRMDLKKGTSLYPPIQH